MKNLLSFSLLVAIALIVMQCAEPTPSGLTISGNIQNAQNIQIFIDEVVIGKASSIVGKSDIDGSGNFSINFPEGLPAGVYNLRVGAKKINLILDGSENKINIDGDLSNLQRYAFQLSGSKDSEIFKRMIQGLMARQINAEAITEFVDTTQSSTLAAYLAYLSLGNNGQFMDTYKSALKRLKEDQPQSEMTKNFSNMVAAIERNYQSQLANQKIRVGEPAPDITLPNPKGKEYSLSDLKGKIVLLDFWASWCGPCRKENPNVVEVYKRYKDQGFTVFSVSLDGIDSRTKARLNSPEQEEKMLSNSMRKWVGAIEQDNLIWDYHVSDLKKWESAPASAYGVRSIPRTFMIDRDGKIAAVNLRGASAIERELKKLL